jgi:hypothetical protein
MTLGEMLSSPDPGCSNCGKQFTKADLLHQIDAPTVEQADLCIECFSSLKPHPENTCEYVHCIIHGIGMKLLEDVDNVHD